LDTRIDKWKGFLIRVGLLLTAFEGSLVATALLTIPGDAKNEWLLGFSLTRWMLVAFVLLVSSITAWGFWIGIRNRSKFDNLAERIARISRSPLNWSMWMAIFLAGSIVGFSFTLNSVSVSYNASNLRLIPISVWIFLTCFQFFLILGWLFIIEHRSLLKEALPDRNTIRFGLIILLISFSLRAVFAYPVIINETPPKFDEFGYFEETIGFEQITRDIISGEYPSEQVLELTYNDGKWPPLHPLLLASINLIFNGGLALSRWSVVIISSLTSVIVFSIGSALAGRKVGLAGAFFHILYPSFIAYGHFLWSETTYIFFLLLSSYTLIRFVKDDQDPRRFFFALLTGIFLGLSGLVRTTTLPFLLVIPIWVYFSRPRLSHRVWLSILIPVICVLIWIPWLNYLNAREGRIIPLATTGGYNLYLGNNPKGNYEDRPSLVRQMDAYAKLHFIDRDLAARTLALKEIKRDPAGFVQRSLTRVVQLWGSDTFLMRHIFNLAYPPIAPSATLWILGFGLLSYFSFWIFSIKGLLSEAIDSSFKWLTVMLVLSGMLLPAISIAITRLHLPLMALLLPFTGVGIVHVKESMSSTKWMIMISTGIAIIFVIASTLSGNIQGFRPSAYYSEPIKSIIKWVDTDIEFKDRLALRTAGWEDGEIRLHILTDGYFFKSNDRKDLVWVPTASEDEITAVLVSETGDLPVMIEISIPSLGTSMVLEPFEPDSWMSWRESRINKLHYSWTGGD